MDSSINFIDVAALTLAQKNEQLLKAAEAGDVNKVGALLQAGADIEAIGQHGYTALMWAAWYGHTAVVSKLIEEGANKENANQLGLTALMVAARNGHAAVVSKLIAAGAQDIEATTQDGYTSMHLAANYGHTAVVAKLIEANANIEAIDPEGYTALITAASSGHAAVVAKLIAAGANKAIVNRDGNTALDSAARENHQDAAFLILRTMSPESRAALKFGQGGCALNRRLAANPVARLAARYEAMASGFERQVCEMYEFFSHPSRPMVNSVLSIMLEYLQAEWLLNANMEAEIRLASRTVRRQERLAIKAAAEAFPAQAPVPVTFRYSASAEAKKEEGLSSAKNKRKGNR